jgi:oligoendopeptidase F
VLERLMRVYFYAVMHQQVDTNDQDAKKMVGQVGGLYAKFMAAGAFMEPELLSIGHDALSQWVHDEPRLAHLAHYFHDLFRRQEHVRSGEVEEVLGMVSEVFQSAQNTYEMLVNADFKFAPAYDGQEVAQSTVGALAGHADRDVRRSAWENYCDTHLAYKNTLAASLTTAVTRDVFMSRVRKHGTALEAALYENNIPTSVFDNLIGTFQKHIPTWHKYWAVKKRALKLDKMHHYDIWAPIATNQPVVSYEQSVEWISAAMAPLGSAYTDAMKRGCLEQRWVDVYPNAGKSAGAFSFGARGTYPFIMMSYTDDLSSMSTLTHELGHSMHSYLTWQNQPAVYSNYSLFVAEVASNFHQAMTRAYLFDHNQDRDFQIALIEEAMDNFHRYFFIMPTLARFEREFHARVEDGRGVTADDLNALCHDLFAEGYGGELELDREREGITWAQFGHLYANFYVFQYATGISAAHALAAPIRAGDTAAAERYVRFLSTGSAKYPIEALKDAGVDMNTPEAVERAYAVLAELVERLDKLTR